MMQSPRPNKRPTLVVATGRPTLVVATDIPTTLALHSVTPGPGNAINSPRTKKGRSMCGPIPKRFASCSVLQGDSVTRGKDQAHVIKCMDVQEFKTHSLCDGLSHVAPIRGSEKSVPPDKRWWVKMDYYPNGDLFQYVVDNGKPSVDLAYKWARQIAAGLYGIHRKGVIHRDIKPENILLDANLDAYIADFGQAYADGNNIRIRPAVKAPSKNYGRPKQVGTLSTYTNKEDDWWSFGVVVFVMLTGCGFELPKLDSVGDLWESQSRERLHVALDVWLRGNDDMLRSTHNALIQVVYSAMHCNTATQKCNISSPMNIRSLLQHLELSQGRRLDSSTNSTRKRRCTHETQKKRTTGKRQTNKGSQTVTH